MSEALLANFPLNHQGDAFNRFWLPLVGEQPPTYPIYLFGKLQGIRASPRSLP